MSNNNLYTRKDLFSALKEILTNSENTIEDPHYKNTDETISKEMLIEFCDKEIEKNTTKKKEPSPQDEVYKAEIVKFLQEMKTKTPMDYTVTEIKSQMGAVLAEISSQKVTSLLGRLIDEKKVTRYTSKGKSYYKLVTE